VVAAAQAEHVAVAARIVRQGYPPGMPVEEPDEAPLRMSGFRNRM
jgi:hypothetical protein